MKLFSVLFVLCLLCLGAQSLLSGLIDGPHVFYSDGSVEEGPLILTDYLHDPQTARQLSLVTGIGSHPSYSAFFRTNDSTGSTYYFWFFPAQNGDPNAPLILWCEGGPGVTSLLSLFYQNGPFFASTNGTTVEPNPYTWNKEYSILYIDNPVGAGYSFTQSPAGWVRDENDVARDLYAFIEQFYTVFSDYLANDLYVIDTYIRADATPSQIFDDAFYL